jgi:transposase-like protein
MTCTRCKHDTAYKFGTYGKRRIQRYRCHSCKATFADAPAKTLGTHYTDSDRAAKVLALMLEGMNCPGRSIQMTDLLNAEMGRHHSTKRFCTAIRILAAAMIYRNVLNRLLSRRRGSNMRRLSR